MQYLILTERVAAKSSVLNEDRQRLYFKDNRGRQIGFFGSTSSTHNLDALRDQRLPILLAVPPDPNAARYKGKLGLDVTVSESTPIVLFPYDDQLLTIAKLAKDPAFLEEYCAGRWMALFTGSSS